MLDLRVEALECMSINIVDGKTTSLLFDPLLNGSKLVNRLGLNRVGTLRGENLKVSSIIRNGNWNTSIVGHTREFREEIESIKKNSGAANDFWSSDLNSNKIFSYKSCWNHLRKKFQEVSWCETVWDKCVCPKMAVCVFKAATNNLLTKEKM